MIGGWRCARLLACLWGCCFAPQEGRSGGLPVGGGDDKADISRLVIIQEITCSAIDMCNERYERPQQWIYTISSMIQHPFTNQNPTQTPKQISFKNRSVGSSLSTTQKPFRAPAGLRENLTPLNPLDGIKSCSFHPPFPSRSSSHPPREKNGCPPGSYILPLNKALKSGVDCCSGPPLFSSTPQSHSHS